MSLDRYFEFFQSDPALRLLRSPHVAFVVSFLNSAFKDQNRITYGHNELAASLADFQDFADRWTTEAGLTSTLNQRAETYLQQWSAGDSRWLTRRLESGVEEPIYELSPSAERVLQFTERTINRGSGFIGTESRLTNIIDTLSDLAIHGDSDTEKRIAHLQQEREKIDQEIERIQKTGTAETFTPTAIRERFHDVLEDLVGLQGDFRAVEESFRRITRTIQHRVATADGDRVAILTDALDAEAELEQADQGVSFREFVRIILSPEKQTQLERICTQLRGMDELADRQEELKKVSQLVPALLQEAEKVLATTYRLSAALRRLLDSNTTSARQRLARVLVDIRTSAAKLAERDSEEGIELAVETELGLNNVFERTFWSAPAVFESSDLQSGEEDESLRHEAFRQLADLQHLDWIGLRQRVTLALTERPSISLAELVNDDSNECGVLDILGLIQIAHDDGHQVNSDSHDYVRVQRRWIHDPAFAQTLNSARDTGVRLSIATPDGPASSDGEPYPGELHDPSGRSDSRSPSPDPSVVMLRIPQVQFQRC